MVESNILFLFTAIGPMENHYACNLEIELKA